MGCRPHCSLPDGSGEICQHVVCRLGVQARLPFECALQSSVPAKDATVQAEQTHHAQLPLLPAQQVAVQLKAGPLRLHDVQRLDVCPVLALEQVVCICTAHQAQLRATCTEGRAAAGCARSLAAGQLTKQLLQGLQTTLIALQSSRSGTKRGSHSLPCLIWGGRGCPSWLDTMLTTFMVATSSIGTQGRG